MQVQTINNSTPQPNFQARNLSRVVSTAKNGVKSVIDVYSVDKKDAEFLTRFADALKGQKLTEDTFAVSGKDAKGNILDAINHAKKSSGSESGLLVAVEDKKNIVGLLDYRERGDIDIKTLYMFKNDTQSMGRKALLLQLLKNVKNRVELYAQIRPENLTEKANKYYRTLGFCKERDSADLVISNTDLGKKINKIQDSSAISVKDLKTSKNVNLVDILKLDE